MEAKHYDDFSSGFMLYRKNDSDEIEYLIMQSTKNKSNWTPPKGTLT